MRKARTAWRIHARVLTLARKPIREAQALRHCEICSTQIIPGEQYHDGGYGCRAHAGCVSTSLAAVPVEG